jgi:hypothetical protein
MVNTLKRFLCVILILASILNLPAAVSVERSVTLTTIEKIYSHTITDLIAINAGYNLGFRVGMVCTISRSDQKIGELILVESRCNRSLGLILTVALNQNLQSGDTVTVKTILSNN